MAAIGTRLIRGSKCCWGFDRFLLGWGDLPVQSPARMIRISCTFPLLLCAASFSQAAVYYTETFPNSAPVAVKTFATVGWFAHVGANATNETNGSDLSGTGDAVIWTSNGYGGTVGYAFGALAAPALYWTTEPSPVSVSQLESFSFRSNNSTTNGFRFALRLDNNTPGDTSDDFWVASANLFDSTSTGSSSNWSTASALESLTFTSTAADWLDLSFTAGTNMALGGARATDLTGNVSAFGLYATGGTVRFDDYTINVVPEPSAAAFSVIAAGLLTLKRRRVTAL